MTENPIRVRLRVVPGAARTEVVGRYGDGWKVTVAAVPERGRANDALERFLARRLALRRRGVAVVAGLTGRDKIVELHGISHAEVDARFDPTRSELP